MTKELLKEYLVDYVYGKQASKKHDNGIVLVLHKDDVDDFCDSLADWISNMKAIQVACEKLSSES